MIERPPKTIEGRAEYFRCNERTIRNMQARGAPLHSVEAMASWILTQKRLAPGLVARMRELTGTNGAPKPREPDADWQKFKAARASQIKVTPSLVQEMEEFAAFFKVKLDGANESGNQGDQKFYSELFFDASNSIRQQKLAADKLGIEEGQLFTKPQLERFIRAFAFHSMRGVDAILAEVCPKVPAIQSANEARDMIEPVLLSERFVKPFARASRVVSESSLSPWMVETIKDAVDDFIERGADEFEKANAP